VGAIKSEEGDVVRNEKLYNYQDVGADNVLQYFQKYFLIKIIEA